jgi:hypothetical protein
MAMGFSLLTLVLSVLAWPAATPIVLPLLPVLGALFWAVSAPAAVPPM